MNKLPTKQIYLLLIIIIGIIALSVYSTYSIFTLEGETSDVVNFKTLTTLDISEEMYEYKQITIPKNSYISTDVDIYNSFDYEVCYSVWYKISTNNSSDKVNVYQYTTEGLTASGTLNNLESRRITLVLTNDSDKDVKVNFGVSSVELSDTCKLNVSTDKNLVLNTISTTDKLVDKLQEEVTTTNEDGYLLYKDYNQELLLEDKIFISNEYTLKDELFTLKDSKEISITEFLKEKEQEENQELEYYTCLNDTSCRILYKINEIKEDKNEEDKDNIIYTYTLTKYDKMVSYTKGESGIKKVNNNYLYYGDNPNNFIYYNCETKDTSSCELWRIVGLYYNEQEDKYFPKIIRNESITNILYNEDDNIWLNSSLDKYLNEDIEINNNFSYKFLEKQEYLKDNKLSLDTKYNDSIIRVMSLSDYLNASICETIDLSNIDNKCLIENWLNNYSKEWTQTYHYLEETTKKDEEEIINIITNKIFTVGSTITSEEVTNKYEVRPVIYLTDRVFLTSGDGTITNPYIIK